MQAGNGQNAVGLQRKEKDPGLKKSWGWEGILEEGRR